MKTKTSLCDEIDKRFFDENKDVVVCDRQALLRWNQRCRCVMRSTSSSSMRTKMWGSICQIQYSITSRKDIRDRSLNDTSDTNVRDIGQTLSSELATNQISIRLTKPYCELVSLSRIMMESLIRCQETIFWTDIEKNTAWSELLPSVSLL